LEYYIFGYGSLVSKESTERTLGRKLEDKTSDFCKLRGYQRVWNYKGRVMIAPDDKMINAVFLNILPSKTEEIINGFLFKVDQLELENLKKRELNYECIDVTNEIFDHSISLDKQKVFTFSCTDKQHLSNDGDQDCFVLKKYDLLVKEAFKKVSEDYYKQYEQTTLAHSYGFVIGSYKGVY